MMYIITVSVVVVALTLIACGIVWTVIQRHRHPEMPPTPEALEEMNKEHPHDKMQPNGGWGNIWT